MIELKEPFALDMRSKIVTVGDSILFIHHDKESNEYKEYDREVVDIRFNDGKSEVKVLGLHGGWKREFYKLGDDTKYGIDY